MASTALPSARAPACADRDRRARTPGCTSDEEVLTHPRHADELGAVRDLVDRDPQPEVTRAGTRSASPTRARWRRRSTRLRRGRRERAGRTDRAPAARRNRASTPSSVAATRRPIGANGLPAMLIAEALHERIEHVPHRDAGSSRPTRAGRARPRARGRAGASPVCSATSSSATTVSPPKSASSDAPRYEETSGSRPATTRATERAVAQSTGSGARTDGSRSVTTRATLGLQPTDLHVVADRHRREDAQPTPSASSGAIQ